MPEQQMPKGLLILLKSFGLDPEQMKQMIGQSIGSVMGKVDELQATMTRVEHKLDLLLKIEQEFPAQVKQALNVPEGTLINGSIGGGSDSR